MTNNITVLDANLLAGLGTTRKSATYGQEMKTIKDLKDGQAAAFVYESERLHANARCYLTRACEAKKIDVSVFQRTVDKVTTLYIVKLSGNPVEVSEDNN